MLTYQQKLDLVSRMVSLGMNRVKAEYYVFTYYK